MTTPKPNLKLKLLFGIHSVRVEGELFCVSVDLRVCKIIYEKSQAAIAASLKRVLTFFKDSNVYSLPPQSD